MASSKPKFYAVRVGRETGIFRTWAQCEQAIKGYSGAVYKKFDTQTEAQAWIDGNSLSQTDSKRSSTESAGGSNPLNTYPFTADFEVYTDGSFVKGKYSWAYAFVKDNEVIYEDSNVGKNPEAAAMRNVAGEIAAVLYAVKRAAELGVRIRIHHDYAGIAFWVTGEWQAKNELTQSYVQLMRKHQGVYVFEKVKAHSGNRFNEYVDQKAKATLGIK